jgi:hypothetical protein
VLAHPLVCNSKTLLNFLRPSERSDWPSAVGPIDLSVHDLPHESSQTEWWYYNTHFTVSAHPAARRPPPPPPRAPPPPPPPPPPPQPT